MNLYRNCLLVLALLLTASGQRVEGQDKGHAEPRCRVVPLPGHRTAFEFGGKEVLDNVLTSLGREPAPQ